MGDSHQAPGPSRPRHRGDEAADRRYRGPVLPERFAAVRDMLARWARDVGMDTDETEALLLASYEALTTTDAPPRQLPELLSEIVATGQSSYVVIDAAGTPHEIDERMRQTVRAALADTHAAESALTPR